MDNHSVNDFRNIPLNFKARPGDERKVKIFLPHFHVFFSLTYSCYTERYQLKFIFCLFLKFDIHTY